MEHNKEYETLLKENTRLKSELDWYKRTYEKRTYWGLQKEFISRKFKKTIENLLKADYIKKKYALSHILLYIHKYGVLDFIKSIKIILDNNGFKSLSKYRKIILKELILNEFTFHSSTLNYNVSIVNLYDIDQLKSEINNFKTLPKISFILPVYNTKPELLKIAITSICNQIYKNWEFCIVDDCSTKPEVRSILNEYRKDSRFKIKFLTENSGISESSNIAIKLASGDFIALMDHDDEITPDALYWIVKEINDKPDADIIYTDECKVDEQGKLSEIFHKPDWSPELLFNMMYVGHLTVYRKSLLDNGVGYFRKEFDFSQDYDLMFRASEKARGIYHIKKILYHWRITEGSAAQGDKPYARQTNLAALNAAMKRRDIDAEIIELPTANRAKINFSKSVLVSIIIPTDSYNNLKASVESIINNTTYLNYEIVAVTNSDLIKKMEQSVSSSNLNFAPYDLPYNFSDKCNHGVKFSKGEIVIFFNDDVRPLQSDWIENTIEFLFIAGVGGVSPKLIYENHTIQYAGMATGVRNLVGTTFHCFHKDSTNYINFPQLVRNVSILSGACLAMKKQLFEKIGGFDSINTPSAHSDVDLSFKILQEGLRCVYTPYATLLHIGHLSLGEFESKQTKIKKDKATVFLLKKWGKYLSEDPYFTQPMRSFLYHDSPEPYHISFPQKQVNNHFKGDILLISHDLSLSGAPILLINIAQFLLSEGYFVVVVCPTDGPLKNTYLNLGIPVIIDELVLRQHDSFFSFAKNFDLAICNTIITWPLIKQLENSMKMIWWIHEAQLINSFTNNNDFINTLKNAKNIIAVSDYSIDYIKIYNKKNITKILNGCNDTNVNKQTGWIKNPNTDKLILSVIGSIEGRKGQDILIDSLSYLNSEELNKIEIWIIGRTLDKEYKKMLDNKTDKYKSTIIFKGEKSHEECIELVNQTDIIVCPSRDDPYPTVLVEGFCLGKLCITSTSTGTVELINNGVNGIIFKSENPIDLAEKLSFILNNEDKIAPMGLNARKTFEKYMGVENFKQKWLQQIDKCISA